MRTKLLENFIIRHCPAVRNERNRNENIGRDMIYSLYGVVGASNRSGLLSVVVGVGERS